MKHTKLMLFCLLLSLCFATAIWQVAEVKLADTLARLSASVFRHSMQETLLVDKDGVPHTCIPGVGMAYDPVPVAKEAVRLYKTRIEPARLQGFLQLSERLEQSLDAQDLIPQLYPLPRAKLIEPWHNAPSQAATMVALANRAGYLRSPQTFGKAQKLLFQLDPENSKLSSVQPEDGIWFWEFGPGEYSLKGMLNTLISLKEYNKLLGDSLSAKLFSRGVSALQKRLPELEQKGWLDDRYHYKNKRSEHLELVSLLGSLNELTPDSLFTSKVQELSRKSNQLVLLQILQRPSVSRIIAFLITWLVLFLIAYLSLKPRKHPFPEPEPDSQ